jgi:hypothetical protein
MFPKMGRVIIPKIRRRICFLERKGICNPE